MKKIYTLSLAILSLTFAGKISAQCHYIAATNNAGDTVTWNLAGGSFQSYGCAPIDPNYWVNGSSSVMTATFVTPQNYPGFRVWGMNDDDTASVYVNGTYYPLNSGTAEYLPKVVCGQSPGPDGVYFANGKLVGSNTNVQGNYSYSDIVLYTSNVNTIDVHGLNGAGWGFAGVVLDCQLTTQDLSAQHSPKIFPSPVNNELYFDGAINSGTRIIITDLAGKEFRNELMNGNRIDVSGLSNGVYLITICNGNDRFVDKFVKQ